MARPAHQDRRALSAGCADRRFGPPDRRAAQCSLRPTRDRRQQGGRGHPAWRRLCRQAAARRLHAAARHRHHSLHLAGALRQAADRLHRLRRRGDAGQRHADPGLPARLAGGQSARTGRPAAQQARRLHLRLTGSRHGAPSPGRIDPLPRELPGTACALSRLDQGCGRPRRGAVRLHVSRRHGGAEPDRRRQAQPPPGTGAPPTDPPPGAPAPPATPPPRPPPPTWVGWRAAGPPAPPPPQEKKKKKRPPPPPPPPGAAPRPSGGSLCPRGGGLSALSPPQCPPPGRPREKIRRTSPKTGQAKYEATRFHPGFPLRPGLRPGLRRRSAADPAGNPDVRRAGEVGRVAAGRQAHSRAALDRHGNSPAATAPASRAASSTCWWRARAIRA